MKESTHTDSELFKLIADDNELAFTHLFYKYSNPIFNYALKIVHVRFCAQEVVQNLFMQIWQQRATLSNIDDPKSYLFRIAANRSIDILRSQEKLIRCTYGHDNFQERVDATEHLINLKETEHILGRAIHQLPEKRKLIYQLRSLEGLSYDEIAKQLHLSRHTVRNQLAKAVRTIRDYLVSHGVSLMLFLYLFR